MFAYNNGATYALGAIVPAGDRRSAARLPAAAAVRPAGHRPTPTGTSAPAGRELGLQRAAPDHRVDRQARPALPAARGLAGRAAAAGGLGGRGHPVHIANPREPNPDWQQGYGYQFWRSRHGYRGDGAYGQFCLVLPEQDAVVVITAADREHAGHPRRRLDPPAAGLRRPDGSDGRTTAAGRLGCPTCGCALVRPGGRTWPVDPLRAGDSWVQAVEVTDRRSAGWTLSVEHGDVPRRLGAGLGADAVTRRRMAPGVAAAGGWRDTSTFVAELAMVQTPHRLGSPTTPRRARPRLGGTSPRSAPPRSSALATT